LLEQSLLQREVDPGGLPRCRMLETVREFALEQLAASGEETAVCHAHAAHLLALAEPIRLMGYRVDGDQLLARLRTEFPNLRAALAWLDTAGDAESLLRLAGALAGFWNVEGLWREGRGWLERALARGTPASAGARATGLAALGVYRHFLGDSVGARPLVEEAFGLFRAAGEDLGVALSGSLCGIVSLRLGDFVAARAFQEASLAAFERLGDDDWMLCGASTILGNLGNIAVGRGDIDTAEDRFLAALERQRATGHAPGTSHPYANHPLAGLGDVARARGDHAAALRWYQEGLVCARRFGDVRATAYALGGVAGTLAAAGRWEEAARLFGAAEAYHAANHVPFELETMDRQRALGLPKPWLRAGEPFGSGQALRDALAGRSVVAPPIPDPEAAARLWAEGRLVPLDEVVTEALAIELGHGAAATDREGDPFGLSPREIDVLRLLVEGHSDRQIAAALSISPKTAGNHVASILGKLGVESRTAAATLAVRRGVA
jgi:DNA-binding CsgD family transcriptional regulator/tetratricopeptide (TPR) repeat protein